MSHKKRIPKVAILADPLVNQNAGIHVYLRELIDKLPLDGTLDYTLVLPKDLELSPLLKKMIVPNFLVPGFSIIRKILIIPLLLRIKAFDLVVEPAHFGPFNLASATKRVTVVHDLTPILFPQFHPGYSSFLHKKYFKKILSKADLIITNSKNTKRDVEEFMGSSSHKIEVVYPSINTYFKKTENKDALIEFELKANNYILSVGTIEPRKNYPTLVEAFDQLLEKNDNENLKLVIAGRKGWQSDDLYTLIKSSKNSDRIKLLIGRSDEELRQLYSHCRLFVYPSIYEGFGIPLLEAHNCGAKCIAANNSSLKEVAADFATFFETMDSEDLALKMSEELNNNHINDTTTQLGNSNFSNEFDALIRELLNL